MWARYRRSGCPARSLQAQGQSKSVSDQNSPQAPHHVSKTCQEYMLESVVSCCLLQACAWSQHVDDPCVGSSFVLQSMHKHGLKATSC